MVNCTTATRTGDPHHAHQNLAWNLEDKGYLLLMLYEKAMRCMEEALELIDAGDMVEKGERLIQAQEIVSQLSDALDRTSVGGEEIVANLERLYLYIYRRLIRGNNRLDREAIGEAYRLMGKLYSAWQQVLQHSDSVIKSSRVRL